MAEQQTDKDIKKLWYQLDDIFTRRDELLEETNRKLDTLISIFLEGAPLPSPVVPTAEPSPTELITAPEIVPAPYDPTKDPQSHLFIKPLEDFIETVSAPIPVTAQVVPITADISIDVQSLLFALNTQTILLSQLLASNTTIINFLRDEFGSRNNTFIQTTNVSTATPRLWNLVTQLGRKARFGYIVSDTGTILVTINANAPLTLYSGDVHIFDNSNELVETIQITTTSVTNLNFRLVLS